MKMNKKQFFSVLKEVVLAFGITATVILCTVAASCRISPEGINIIGGSYQTPQLLHVDVDTQNNVEVVFSKPVSFVNLVLQNQKNDDKIELEQIESQANENHASYVFEPKKELSCAENYVLFGIIEDEKLNSLTFATEISGFNNDVPKLILSEIRNKYSKPNLEFIEFQALSSGNIAGVVLEIVYKNAVTTYTFPAIDVAENQFFVLHLRTKDETCVDEIQDENGNNFSASTYEPCSVDGVCDLWVKSDEKIIGDCGIILLKSRKNGKLIDAFVFGASEADFETQMLKSKYKELVSSDLWDESKEADEIYFADTSLATVSRTINRIKVSEKIDFSDWIIVKAKKATPGFENSTEEYER